MSALADNGATDIVDIEVGGDDSPRSLASPEVMTPRMGRPRAIYTLNHNLVHSSSRTSASRERSPSPDHHHPHPPPGSRYRACRALRSRTAHINPVERTIQLMGIGSTSPPHELRGGSRDDGGESACDNWDLQQGDVLQSFMDQRVRTAMRSHPWPGSTWRIPEQHM